MRSVSDPAIPTADRPPARLLVFGDLMLDRTVYGVADRTSPEAPILILRAGRREARPGGAAAVASLLCGLGLDLDVQLAGVVGDDSAGMELQESLRRCGVQSQGLVVDRSRPTTVKERFIGQTSGQHGQQVLRVDYESTTQVSDEVAESLWERVRALIPQCDVALISDYAKGVCTPGLLTRMLDLCHARRIPVLVDPARGVDPARYAGAALVKPNRTWLELATGRTIDDVASARSALQRLRETHGWRTERLLLTLDHDGMLLDDPGRDPEHFPARIRTVSDVTGAGDLVHAVMGACVADGWNWRDAAETAVVAAGLEVERFGVAPVAWTEIIEERSGLQSQQGRDSIVPSAIGGALRIGDRPGSSPEEPTGLDTDVTTSETRIRLDPCWGNGAPTGKIVSRAGIQTHVAQARRAGRSVVLTNGCFDLLHAGHIRLLQQAAELGDALIVAINSDRSVRRLKGPERPFIVEQQRAELLAAIACVDWVVVFDEETPIPLLLELQPDVLVKGAQYTHQQVVGGDVVTNYGGRIVTLPMVPGLSTTQLANELAGRMQGLRVLACSEDEGLNGRHSGAKANAGSLFVPPVSSLQSDCQIRSRTS